MIAVLLATLQAASGPPADMPVPVAPPGPATGTSTRCPERSGDDGDVVVCGRPDPQEEFRLRPLTRRYDPVGGPGTGFRIGSGQGNVYAASGQSQDGKPDKRIMVTLKFPF